MSKPIRKQTPRSDDPRIVLGLPAFIGISAVEGIALSPEMLREFEEFDRQGLSDVERRARLTAKYGRPDD